MGGGQSMAMVLAMTLAVVLVTMAEDALRRQSEKNLPTLKSIKYLATKLMPVATSIPVIDHSTSLLWIDLNSKLGHGNATFLKDHRCRLLHV